MANDDLTSALSMNLAVAPRRQAQQQAVAPRVLDPTEIIDEPMMGLARAFSGFKDPWIRELVKGSVESRMSRVLGYRVELPSEEDTQLKRMLAEKTQLDLTRQLAEGRTALARAVLIDLDEKQKLAVGFGGMSDPLSEDPDRALAVLQKLGLPLTRGDLAMAKADVLTTAQAQERKQAATLESQAKEGRERKSLLETDAFLGKTVAEGAKGEGAVGQEFKQITEGVEKARGASLGGFFDTDIDEARGSAGVIDVIRATREGSIGRKIGRDKSAALIIGRFGKDIADQIEGLETDPQGRLVVSSDAGVEREAAFNLQTAIRMLADDLGMAPADLMKQYLGLEYTGLDDTSYVTELLKMAGGDQAKALKFLKDNGIRIEASQ